MVDSLRNNKLNDEKKSIFLLKYKELDDTCEQEKLKMGAAVPLQLYYIIKTRGRRRMGKHKIENKVWERE